MTSCQPHSTQRQLAGAHAIGQVLGPHIGTPPRPGKTGNGPPLAAPKTGRWESESA